MALSSKRVAVIGVGSSGIQIISNIASQVQHLYTWMRSPTWITAGFAQKFAGPDGGNFRYTDNQKKIFQDDPELFKRYSKMIESELNVRFKFILNDTPEAQAAKEFARNEMMQKLAGNEALMDAMTDDEQVLVLGEDIADPEEGGVVGITKGLSSKFGELRLRTTPIAEEAIIGADE